MDINKVWINILKYEGEEFETITGLRFTYKVIDDHTIQPIREGNKRWKLSKSLLEKAINSIDKLTPSEFSNTIIGSSYVRALLEDNRINQ